MNHFPQHCAFAFPWRPYQQRVLDELQQHLTDERVHIVAPPGSGKTVLGLEIMRRIGRPALILSPTLTIRNQWIERFLELFLNTRTQPDWISSDIHNPALLTVSTYQGLHVALQDSAPEGEGSGRKATNVLLKLRQQNIATLVMDEAHHLQKEWWKSLDKLRKGLKQAHVVALTATPPYDVSGSEWERYSELCGPVDAEICIPEMVLEASLCPHQDYIWFSLPQGEGALKTRQFRAAARQFVTELQANHAFTLALQNTPFLLELQRSHFEHGKPEPAQLEAILAHSEFYFALLIYLTEATGIQPPYLTSALAADRQLLPRLDYKWLEILLNGVIYQHIDAFSPEEQQLFEDLRASLQKTGAIEDRQVRLQSTRRLQNLLSRDISKLQSIRKIVQHEAGAQRPQDLRIAILTDTIYRDLLPAQGKSPQIKKTGVVPIFETLRQELPEELRIAVLCGTLQILPVEVLDELELAAAAHYGIAPGELGIKPLEHDRRFFFLDGRADRQQHLVALVTGLFTRGHIQILIGTQALLGEGWDAPEINTLILASVVGTHVTSNQMRGRALRTVAADADKVANIWHLACVEEGASWPGDDLQKLERRFKTFMGLDIDNLRIENGLERLKLPSFFDAATVNALNSTMKTLSAERTRLPGRWQEALECGDKALLRRHQATAPRKRDIVQLPAGRVPGYQIQTHKLRFGYTLLATGGLAAASPFIYQLFAASEASMPLLLLASLAAVGSSRYVFKHARSTFRRLTRRDDLENIAGALLQALFRSGVIKGAPEKVILQLTGSGEQFSVTGEGLSAYEQGLFLEAFAELFDPPGEPRYLLVRPAGWFNRVREACHPVPTVLGRQRKTALILEACWKERVGKARVYYCKSLAGRHKLLKARAAALTSTASGRANRVSRWE